MEKLSRTELEYLETHGLKITNYVIPTVLYQDVIRMLPKVIRKDDSTYFLSILYDLSNGVVITYATDHIKDILHSTGGNELQAAYDMLCWVLETKSKYEIPEWKNKS